MGFGPDLCLDVCSSVTPSASNPFNNIASLTSLIICIEISCEQWAAYYRVFQKHPVDMEEVEYTMDMDYQGIPSRFSNSYKYAG